MLNVILHQQEPVILDVEFSCAENQLLTLVGPSGSGKTTILRCIAGLHHADSGLVQNGESVLWDGAKKCSGANTSTKCWYGLSKLCAISAFRRIR